MKLKNTTKTGRNPCCVTTLTTLSCLLTTEWCLSALAWSPCSAKAARLVQDQTRLSPQLLWQALGKWLWGFYPFHSTEPGPARSDFLGKLWERAELKSPQLRSQPWPALLPLQAQGLHQRARAPASARAKTNSPEGAVKKWESGSQDRVCWQRYPLCTELPCVQVCLDTFLFFSCTNDAWQKQRTSYICLGFPNIQQAGWE